MGLAWVPDDSGRAVAPASRRDWTGGPRHRRPTLLARSGQAVACRITALARTDSDAALSRSAHPQRPPATIARRYWA
jgi:hypothetical protein